MKLSIFNGGLNTRQSELLIAPNEATECENVDTSTGVVVSAKDIVSAAIASTNKPYYFDTNDEWVDMAGADTYMEYQGKLYWSVVGGRAQKYNGTDTYNLGINAPTTIPYTSVISRVNLAASITSTTYDPCDPPPPVGECFPGNDGYARFTHIVYYPGTTFYDAATWHYNDSIEHNYAQQKDVVPRFNGTSNYTTHRIYGRGKMMELGYVVPYIGSLDTLLPPIIYDIDLDMVETATEGAPAFSYTFTVVVHTPNKIGIDQYTFSHISTAGFAPVLTLYVTGDVEVTDIYINTPLAYVEAPAGTEFIVGSAPLDMTVAVNNTFEETEPEFPWISLTGSYTYTYTYYNEEDGTESQPAPLGQELTVTSQSINIIVQASSDPQVTHVRVYRVGGTLLSFTYVFSIPVPTTEKEDTTSDDAVSGVLLSSSAYGNPQDGLKFLRHVYGLFIGAIEAKFYFTLDIGNPNYWPETYYINFESEITGLAIAGSGIIVFTLYKSYIIIGTNANTFVKYTLSEEQGCINGHTVVERGAQVLFMSTDGLCSTSGSDVKVISKHKLGKQNLDTINATVYDETYYLQLADDRILAFDYRYEPHLKHYDFGTDYLVTGEDKLYGRKGGTLYEMFAGGLVEFTYTTGRLTEGSASLLKSYKTVYVHATGTHTITVSIDDIVVLSQVLADAEGPLHEIQVPQSFQQGYDIEFKLVGTGTVNEIEYKAMPREQM